MQSGETIQSLIADDGDLIMYRPALRSITKSISSAILLSQIMYWDKDARKKGKTKFYKFKLPSDHPAYIQGDSWCEELNISRHEFDSALQNIGCKRPAKNKPQDTPEMQAALVWYNTDMGRLTWYEINTTTLRKALKRLYDESYEGNSEEHHSSRKATKRLYVKTESSVSLYTENTTENIIKNCFSKEKQKSSTPALEDDAPLEHKEMNNILPKKLTKLVITPNPYDYSPQALRIITHWKKCGGRVHTTLRANKGVEKIKQNVEELLMDGLNTCYKGLTRNQDLKMKQWTVQEIITAIDTYACIKNKPVDKMYFNTFVSLRYNGFGNRKLRDHSPLLDSFENVPNEQTVKWQEKLRTKFKILYPKVQINPTVLLNCASFLGEQDKLYKIKPGKGASYDFHIRNIFIAYVRRIVTEAGTHDPLKYISGKQNLKDFITYSVTKSFLLVKKTKKERA